MARGFLIVLAGVWGACLVGATVSISPNSDLIRYVGRFDHSAPHAPRFDMNGCEIQFWISGATSISVGLSQRITPGNPDFPPIFEGNPMYSEVNDFMVFIDGQPNVMPASGSECTYCTFDTHGSRNDTVREYIVASGLSPGVHAIRIVKATEPAFNDAGPSPNWMTFHGITLDAGGALAPQAPRRQRRIEFVGDSITAGYCNLCGGPGNHSSVNGEENTESFIVAWPWKICESLGAECHTLAWSGMGLIHNCCGGDVNIPAVLSRTVATDSTTRWDATSWKPDAVVINIGTNDGQYAQTDGFYEAMKGMVHQAAQSYGPDVRVFLACGPMSEVYCQPVDRVIAEATASGIHALFLDQRGFLNGTFGPACCGHPGAKVDSAMAEAGAAVIAKALRWQEETVVETVVV